MWTVFLFQNSVSSEWSNSLIKHGRLRGKKNIIVISVVDFTASTGIRHRKNSLHICIVDWLLICCRFNLVLFICWCFYLILQSVPNILTLLWIFLSLHPYVTCKELGSCNLFYVICQLKASVCWETHGHFVPKVSDCVYTGNFPLGIQKHNKQPIEKK